MMWLFTITLLVVIVGKEVRKERQDFIKRNGMTRNQLFRACKYMRGENGKVSYRELLQNMNNN
jgi:hypothetical protein